MKIEKSASKSFLKYLSIFTLLFLAIIGLITYWIDPLMQFRITDNQYLLNPRLVNPGLAKNYEYNTVIIGSSMVQNFDLDILRKKGHSKPLKLASGALNVTETVLLHTLIDKNKAKTIIISLDPPPFNSIKEPNLYPHYLCEDGIYNKLMYLYGYEPFVRYAPVDLALKMYTQFDTLSPYFAEKANIDNIGNFRSESNFGFEVVKSIYLKGNAVSNQEASGMEIRLPNRFDYFESEIGFHKYPQVEYIIIFPPYSALYWRIAKEKSYYEKYKDFVRHVNGKLAKYPNIKIAFFYDMDEIVDLNNYFDVTHFTPNISDKILENIQNPVYYLDSTNIEKRMLKFDSLVTSFENKNESWLNKD